MTQFVLFAIAFIILCSSGAVRAQTSIAPSDFVYPAPHLSNIIQNAAKIARVHVVGREALYGDALHQTPICGYLIRVKVVEAFKGGNEPFSFVSAVASDFPDSDHDYLVFANFQPGVSGESQLALGELTAPRNVTTGQMACLLHQLSSPGYYVPSVYQTSWQFDAEAHERLEGEWLSASARKDGLFCGLQARQYLEKNAHSAFRVAQIGIGQNRHYVIAWSDVRRLLQAGSTTTGAVLPCE